MKDLYLHFPDTPGVYLMRDAAGKLLYVGKAVNLRRRVSSYFLRPHDARIQMLVSKIAKIDYRATDTAIEALILEAKLIKQYDPPYNIREKDDKSFLYVEVTREKCPRVLLVRGKDIVDIKTKAKRGKDAYGVRARYGPFTSAHNLKEALKIIRRIFPYNIHDLSTHYALRTTHSHSRPCFDYELGLCPGFCGNRGDSREYRKNIKNITLFFEGKKDRIIRNLTKEMQGAAQKQDYEKAEKYKRRIFALQHIQDIALISEDNVAPEKGAMLKHSTLLRSLRIEGYDISNISGTSAVGSMVVFTNGEPDRAEYRKFRIKSIEGSDDTGMLTEVLTRRFARSVIPAKAGIQKGNWPLPDAILIDGGKGQVNAARKVLAQYRLKIPIVGLAKGPERKRNDLVGLIPKGLAVDLKTLIRIRDEAHRFAIRYHKEVRARNFLS